MIRTIDQQHVSIRSVLCSYSSTDADYAEIPDDDDDADYAHPMAGLLTFFLFFNSNRSVL